MDSFMVNGVTYKRNQCYSDLIQSYSKLNFTLKNLIYRTFFYKHQNYNWPISDFLMYYNLNNYFVHMIDRFYRNASLKVSLYEQDKIRTYTTFQRSRIHIRTMATQSKMKRFLVVTKNKSSTKRARLVPLVILFSNSYILDEHYLL
jgi:hypothetical protein